MTKGAKRVAVIADTHGDRRNINIIKAFRSFCDEFKPDLIIHLGDNWELSALRAGANEHEKNQDILPDLEAGMDTLIQVFSTRRKKVRKVYLWGNHDLRRVDRFQKAARAEVRHAANVLKKQMTDCVDSLVDESYPYCSARGVFEYQGINFLHGYAHGVYARRKHAFSYGNCVIGHIHSDGQDRVEALGHPMCVSVPCASDVYPEFSRSQMMPLRHTSGFSWGFLCKTRGIFQINAEVKSVLQ